MNKVYLIGNTTKDAEKSETPSGVAVCRFSIAVNRNVGEEKVADFFNVVVWRGLAETCGKYLAKGKKVAVFGSLQNRSYEDREGNKRLITEIVANEVEFLSAVNNDEKPQMKLEEVENDNDLPF